VAREFRRRPRDVVGVVLENVRERHPGVHRYPIPIVDAKARDAVDGRDLTTRVPLSPSEAALGARLEVATLGGRVNVKVPPGTSSGHRLRLKGRGLPGKPPGDQYLEFHIMVPKTLTPREQELYEALAEASTFDPREAREARS